MYQKIKKHHDPRKIYAERLIEENTVSTDDVQTMINDYRDALDHGECVVKEWRPMEKHSVDWRPTWATTGTCPTTPPSLDKLQALGDRRCDQYPGRPTPCSARSPRSTKTAS
jgi:2-oxoglutarate dehydrogenase E1 component